jgi:hypothetical protein
MPRPGPRQVSTTIRLPADVRAAIDRRARDEVLTVRGGEPNRSEMVRIVWAYAREHMPEGWRPAGDG